MSLGNLQRVFAVIIGNLQRVLAVILGDLQRVFGGQSEITDDETKHDTLKVNFASFLLRTCLWELNFAVFSPAPEGAVEVYRACAMNRSGVE